MMKKLLILMLVLGIASAANATITYEFRDATGTTILSELDVVLNSTFTFCVFGDGPQDIPWQYGVYSSDQTDGGGVFDFDGVTYYPAGGDLCSANYYAEYDGADCLADDIRSDVLPNPTEGMWFKLDASLNPGAQYCDWVVVDILDPVTFEVVESLSIHVVPEPMTIALLGLGGLFLRRRK